VGAFLRREPGSDEVLSLEQVGGELRAVGLASLGGFLGGELVVRLGVGVAEGAHLDAPSSLSGRPVGRSSNWRAEREIVNAIIGLGRGQHDG
jgi:hypothetical protein